MNKFRFKRALLIYVVVTVVGAGLVFVGVQQQVSRQPAVPAIADGSDQQTGEETMPTMGLLERAFQLVHFQTDTLKDFFRMTVPYMGEGSEAAPLQLSPTEMFGALFRYLTGIRPGDPRTVFATQVPFLVVEGDPDPDSGELILPKPGDNVIIDAPSPDPTATDPEIARLIKAGKPLVLVYHTHTQESYLGPNYRNQGLTHDDAFEADRNKNLVAVGQEFARVLQEEYGIGVIHVTDYFDMRPGGGVTKIQAYVRSLQKIEPIVKANPQLRLVVDIHRDAYSKPVQISEVVAQVPDEGQAARMLFVVAQGIPGQLEQPYWQHGLGLSENLTDWLEHHYPGLMRGILKAKNARYNQHLTPGSLLVEVGEVHNTLGQAKASARILAHAVARQIYSGNIKTATQVESTR